MHRPLFQNLTGSPLALTHQRKTQHKRQKANPFGKQYSHSLKFSH
jgi:hypothetical protein